MAVAEEIAHVSINAIFRAFPIAVSPKVLFQLERRERVVLMLLDGRRTLHAVAILVHRSEVDVARILVHLLKSGYIEYLGE